MILHPMYVHAQDPERTIAFEVNLHAPSIFGHLKFIQYLQIKFDGTRQAIGKTVRDGDHPFGTTSVLFPESTFDAAKAFCDAKLMENGSPNADFCEELEHAALSNETDRDLHWEMTGTPNNPYQEARM